MAIVNAYGDDVDQTDPAAAGQPLETYDEDLDDYADDVEDGDAEESDEDIEPFDDDDDDDDSDDDLEDASADDIDLVVATYREDGSPVVQALALDLANDLDELIAQLRRLPGDSGAMGSVSIAGEFFVLVRVRGGSVQVLLSDAVAANDWPLAHDVVEFLGLDIPDEDDDPELVGDGDILADQGISEFDLENLVEDLDDGSDEQVFEIMDRLRFGAQFRRVVEAQQNRQ